MQHISTTRVVLVAVPPRSKLRLGKECDIWEPRDRRAEQWQHVISYSQLDTL